MKNFTIKVTEYREGLFVVEAEDEDDALERLGRIIDTDFFWNDFENGGEYSLSTEVELDERSSVTGRVMRVRRTIGICSITDID